MAGLLLLVSLGACRDRAPAATGPRTWALALHGGVGRPAGASTPARRAALERALRSTLSEGARRLDRGASALDVVEIVVRDLEDSGYFNAGRGAVADESGEHRLDAAIMDGRSLACGAVAGVATVRHPVALARQVMERSPYVLLAGAGAERFADEMKVERVSGSWFVVPGGRGRNREDDRVGVAPARRHGTVGAVALDREGRLAAATSTGGLSGQLSGRVGAVPLIGSGTWADRNVAVSCSGRGEEFIRHGLARELATLVEVAGMTPDQAARKLVFETLKPGDGGLIAVGRDGSIAVEFNTGSMVRAAADSTGRFDLEVWY